MLLDGIVIFTSLKKGISLESNSFIVSKSLKRQTVLFKLIVKSTDFSYKLMSSLLEIFNFSFTSKK